VIFVALTSKKKYLQHIHLTLVAGGGCASYLAINIVDFIRCFSYPKIKIVY
jgi:hypothetical protein